MKSVLISIQPKWCKLISEGKKTVEVRKTKPKLDVPFKCYIYETQGRTETPFVDEEGHYIFKGRGQVIGEFVCDKVYDLKFVPKEYYGKPSGTFEQFVCENSCLSFEDIKAYIKGKSVYAWHISNLVIYDKPKELGEFKTVCKEWQKDFPNCDGCKYFIDGRGYEYDESDCGCDGLKPVTRPPQSWCYVEELGV